MSGFLHTGATFQADLTLAVEVAMGMALLVGWRLARRRHFRAHARCQTAVLGLNSIAVALLMVPSFARQIAPNLAEARSDAYYSIALAHATLGTCALVLGWYVVLAARGVRVIPPALRCTAFRPWMRATLALWWLTIGVGAATYVVWYTGAADRAVAPSLGPAAPGLPRSAGATVSVRNFDFDPQDITVKAGTTVTWTDAGGRHTVSSVDGQFDSGTLVAGQAWQKRFDTPGTYLYFCANHGTKAGAGMTGRVIVTAR